MSSTGLSKTTTGTITYNSSDIGVSRGTDGYTMVRTNQTVDVTNYNYLKVLSINSNTVRFRSGIDKTASVDYNEGLVNCSDAVYGGSVATCDISSHSGYYYLYIWVYGTGSITQIYLSKR